MPLAQSKPIVRQLLAGVTTIVCGVVVGLVLPGGTRTFGVVTSSTARWTDPSGTFQVALPGSPVIQHRTVNFGGVPVEATAYLAQSGAGLDYGVTQFDLSPLASSSHPAATLGAFGVENYNVSSVSPNALAVTTFHQGQPMVQVTATLTGSTAVAEAQQLGLNPQSGPFGSDSIHLSEWLTADGPLLIGVQVISTVPNPPGEATFLKSFRLIHPPAPAPSGLGPMFKHS
ncbi:MAG: hypothetical protein JWM85_2711 [Acidimicrobiaceae bacterium]|nr:hypothetical protein [Acidimicrobiaceae bacterium]